MLHRTQATSQIALLLEHVKSEFNILPSTAMHTSYANSLKEIMPILEKRLEESEKMDEEKSISRAMEYYHDEEL